MRVKPRYLRVAGWLASATQRGHGYTSFTSQCGFNSIEYASLITQSKQNPQPNVDETEQVRTGYSDMSITSSNS